MENNWNEDRRSLQEPCCSDYIIALCEVFRASIFVKCFTCKTRSHKHVIIKGMGYEKWLSNKLASIEVFELNAEQKANSFQIINLITSWAIEEGYLKVEDLNDFC